uniref:Uncharacterized protein n=1 Tax=Anguilla anguilla TaxID=7936 RepID=A0A0E9XR56_ANGAN
MNLPRVISAFCENQPTEQGANRKPYPGKGSRGSCY